LLFSNISSHNVVVIINSLDSKQVSFPPGYPNVYIFVALLATVRSCTFLSHIWPKCILLGFYRKFGHSALFYVFVAHWAIVYFLHFRRTLGHSELFYVFVAHLATVHYFTFLSHIWPRCTLLHFCRTSGHSAVFFHLVRKKNPCRNSSPTRSVSNF
jgi:hypothetical protein